MEHNSSAPAEHRIPPPQDLTTPPPGVTTPPNAITVVPHVSLDERCRHLWSAQYLPQELAALIDDLCRVADGRGLSVLDLFVDMMLVPFEAIVASIVALRLSPTQVGCAFLTRLEQQRAADEAHADTVSPLRSLIDGLPGSNASHASVTRELIHWLALVRTESRARAQYLDIMASTLAGFEVSPHQRKQAVAEWAIACHALRAFSRKAHSTTRPQ